MSRASATAPATSASSASRTADATSFASTASSVGAASAATRSTCRIHDAPSAETAFHRNAVGQRRAGARLGQDGPRERRPRVADREDRALAPGDPAGAAPRRNRWRRRSRGRGDRRRARRTPRPRGLRPARRGARRRRPRALARPRAPVRLGGFGDADGGRASPHPDPHLRHARADHAPEPRRRPSLERRSGDLDLDEAQLSLAVGGSALTPPGDVDGEAHVRQRGGENGYAGALRAAPPPRRGSRPSPGRTDRETELDRRRSGRSTGLDASGGGRRRGPGPVGVVAAGVDSERASVALRILDRGRPRGPNRRRPARLDRRGSACDKSQPMIGGHPSGCR